MLIHLAKVNFLLWRSKESSAILVYRDTPEPVLWIRDIFARIRIRGSVPLNNGPGSGPADPDPVIFVLDLQEANKKQFFSKFFCLLVY